MALESRDGKGHWALFPFRSRDKNPIPVPSRDRFFCPVPALEGITEELGAHAHLGQIFRMTSQGYLGEAAKCAHLFYQLGKS